MDGLLVVRSDIDTLLTLHLRSGIRYGFHDILVASASTEIPRDPISDFSLCRMWVTLKEGQRGQNDAWRAEATLQPMVIPKGLLYWMKLSIFCKAFYCEYVRAICLNCEHCTGLDILAIVYYSTSSTIASVAPDVCAS